MRKCRLPDRMQALATALLPARQRALFLLQVGALERGFVTSLVLRCPGSACCLAWDRQGPPSTRNPRLVLAVTPFPE